MKTRVSRSRLRGASNFWVGTAQARSRPSTSGALTLVRNPGLLVLNDFSMGLGPGYRRLFVECLRDYLAAKRSLFSFSRPYDMPLPWNALLAVCTSGGDARTNADSI